MNKDTFLYGAMFFLSSPAVIDSFKDIANEILNSTPSPAGTVLMAGAALTAMVISYNGIKSSFTPEP